MAITVMKDKEVIRALLNTNKDIEIAGFKKENIRTTKASPDILNSANPELQIFISLGQPEYSNPFGNVKNLTYDISVSGKRNYSNRIDDTANKIIELLNERDIGNGHILYLLDVPLELASNPSVYIVEMSFLCQSII